MTVRITFLVYQWGLTGLGNKASARLCECFRQAQAEVVSNSKSKIHQTWPMPFSQALYVWMDVTKREDSTLELSSKKLTLAHFMCGRWQRMRQNRSPPAHYFELTNIWTFTKYLVNAGMGDNLCHHTVFMKSSTVPSVLATTIQYNFMDCQYPEVQQKYSQYTVL